MKNQQHFYAIIRIDEFLGDNVAIENKITIKEIVRTLEDAEFEVKRLTKLNHKKGIKYFWQTTRMKTEI